MRTLCSISALIGLVFLSACAGGRSGAAPTGLAGRLILIGGAIRDENRPVYERFVELALVEAAQMPEGGPAPLILIATAASGDEAAAGAGKAETIRLYAPPPLWEIETIGRETPTDRTVELIDRASAIFFTGGDQKRITERYRPGSGGGGDTDGPEALAMRRLLARGGVIAGTSAGDAMMGPVMFHTGRSAEALGIRSTRSQRGEDDDPDEKRVETPLGPQIGPGMGFLPWAIADSHFFERHRFGRLVAALEASGTRLGIGVSEDAAVEVDLSTGELVGLSERESLLVDIGSITREGLARRGVRAMLVEQGTRVNLARLFAPVPVKPVTAFAPGAVEIKAQGERGGPSPAAVFFRQARTIPVVLELDGYTQRAGPSVGGWSVVELAPR